MLTNIAKAYLFSGKLGRLEFFVAVSLASLLVRLTSSFLLDALSLPMGLFDYWHFVAIGLLLAVLLIPLFAARLKDIGWPPVLAVFVAAPTIPLLYYQFHKATGGMNATFQSAWYVNGSNFLGLGLVVFAVCLALIPGRAPRHI